MLSALDHRELSPSGLYRIRFQDCDPFGHLNNARYMDYFLEAREDHLRDFYGFDLFEHASREGKSWVVTRTQIAYLEPAKQSDLVRIATRLTSRTDGSIRNEDLMYDQSGKRLKAMLWIDFAYVDLGRGRPTRHGEDLVRFFDSVLYRDSGSENGNFEERVREMKRTLAPGTEPLPV
ncbi:acyl-CoA thioesterase [Leptospira ellisii]|uniref:Thioesterase n=1 Tax=Leptospira ellisii TaxID=2023197 RepID=A0A2N0BJE7_9LEPT|nr:acyl-CoA thioesterase [Leptospira ellisii]MDV6236627.1 acyl-CoA thioesterase [Leptospira ellisii]PJZ93868.1 thioesterase [Leptospira ellisii]PKA04139.1 thioesterase [Leptospira ellisii]